MDKTYEQQLEDLVKEAIALAVLLPAHGGVYAGTTECKFCGQMGNPSWTIEHEPDCWMMRARRVISKHSRVSLRDT